MPASDQGINTKRYQLIPRVLAFITSGERVLLLKNNPKAGQESWAGLYNGVGGHIERGEDVLSAAAREVFEETGLTVTDLWLCGVITIDTGGEVGIGLYVFRGADPQGELAASGEGALEWVSLQDVLQMPLVEDLPALIPRIFAMRPGDTPVSAQYSYNEAGQLMIHFHDSREKENGRPDA